MLATGLLLLAGTAYEAYQSTQDMKSYPRQASIMK